MRDGGDAHSGRHVRPPYIGESLRLRLREPSSETRTRTRSRGAMTADEQHTASLSSPITHSRRGLHGHVVDVLGQRIISGELSSGTVIEPDRLVTELQVSRTVVREVIKVLTTKGLLDARPRTGTYVLPRSRWNLLNADVIVWRNARKLEPDCRSSWRRSARSSSRGRPTGRDAALGRRARGLERALAALEASTQENHESKALAMLTEADVRFHRGVLAAAGNEFLERLERLLDPRSARVTNSPSSMSTGLDSSPRTGTSWTASASSVRTRPSRP